MAISVGLIIIGDEILSGKRADKHLPKTIELLQERGLSLSWVRAVGDERERITPVLKDAFASGDVVFCCGGIGATPDDHTRQCAAAALGVDLFLHPEAKDLIQARMRDVALEKGLPYEPDHPDNLHRLNMGVFPVGAQIIPNPYNKIPGFTCQTPTSTVHFLPGFPVMAWPMMAWALDTLYAEHHQVGAWQEQSVVVYGAMEATLTPLMEQIEALHPIKVFSLPSVDHPVHGRHIELGVKGAPTDVGPAFEALMTGLARFELSLGPQTVRP